MMSQPEQNKVLYGGDYNPEQWDPQTWEEDMRLLKLAGIDTLTINVFNWAALQPDETTYRFEGLDQTIARATEHGMNICLATSTGAHPAWMAKRHPDILRVEFNGSKRKFGGRHNSCPNSPTYQLYSARLAEELAKRYRNQPNLAAWHISNEYGGACYCENCEKAFRTWLQQRYGSLEALNRAWNTSFWGHTFYDWDEIVAPNLLSEHFAPNRTMFQGISLDYARFNSDSMLENYKAEYRAVKAHMPHVPVTTNLMGLYKPLDYQKWAKHMDFISFDNYPANDAPIAQTALQHEMMRGIKGGQPFWLMEQTPSVSNWLAYNSLKRPGVLRLWSYQAVAHGSDTVLYFQMRRSPGACEKFHGAVIDHVGNENTRVFRECAALGEELAGLGSAFLGSRMRSKVAILFDWDNWWAIEYSAGPNTELKYPDEVLHYYQALHGMNISTDIIGVDDDFSAYDLIIAPVLYMVKPGLDRRLKDFVAAGGRFVTTFFSGIVDESDRVLPGGYPGSLRDLLGIWVEEIDALPQGTRNHFTYQGTEYPAMLLCDILHCEGAESLAAYQQDFYQGYPVVTRNHYGKGQAWYIASRSDNAFYHDFLAGLCRQAGISPVLETPHDVEATCRYKDGKAFTFVLNHNATDASVSLPFACADLLTGQGYQPGGSLLLAPKGVAILESAL